MRTQSAMQLPHLFIALQKLVWKQKKEKRKKELKTAIKRGTNYRIYHLDNERKEKRSVFSPFVDWFAGAIHLVANIMERLKVP